MQATPESLVPPSAVRSTIVRATRSTFARTVSELSVGEFFSLFVQAIRSFFAALSTAGKGKADRESCDVFGEGTAEEYHCKVNLDKRRKKIAGLMLKSKLRGWGGFASAAALFALLSALKISGMPGAPSYTGPLDCFRQTVRTGGVAALYQGLLPNMLKVMPATSISYAVYDALS